MIQKIIFDNRVIHINTNNNSISELNKENKEDNDNQSNISFITELEKIKNFFTFKESEDFCYGFLKLIIFVFLFLIIIKFGIRYNSVIRAKISETAKTISNPKRLFIDIIWGTTKAVLIGIFWKYLFIMIPLAIISYMTYKYAKRNKFKKTCKKIIEDIKNDLRNSPKDNYGRKSMPESEIISKYSKKYKIDFNVFIKKYLKQIKKLREKEHSLKIVPKTGEQGIVISLWELNETII